MAEDSSKLNLTILLSYIQSDLYRNSGTISLKQFIKFYLFSRSFKVSFWYRLARYCYLKKIIFFEQIIKIIFRHVCIKYCIDLPIETNIGFGLLIYHGFGIVINSKTQIGNNFTISHQVTIGADKGQVPIIGDNVIVGAGAKIIGGVKIGQNAFIGSNAVVINNVPDNTITVGIPNKIINRKYQDTYNRNYWLKF